MKKLSLLKAVLAVLVFSVCSQVHAKNLNLAVVVYDKAELLDFAGPLEVFSTTSRVLQSLNKTDTLTVYTVAAKEKQMQSAQGFKFTADYTLKDAPTADIVAIPGGDPADVPQSAEFFAWLKANSGAPKITMSVCTGAYTLALAGMLDGKQATTHHLFLDRLQAEFPKITVLRNVRFVDQGDVVTTAGVSAGIDGALHIIDRVYGRDVALAVVSILEYNWNP